MKKLVAILLALILSLSVAASLAEIVNPLSPLIDVNRLEGRFVLASVRSAGNGRIEFTLYEAERYAKADLEKLKKGDILVSDGQEVTVQTVSLVNETCTVNAGLEDEVLLQANEFGEYLISLDDEHVEKLQAISGAYARSVIPAGTYEGIDEDIVTVGIKATIIANEDVTEDEAYTIVSTIFGNKDAITEAHAKGAELDLAYASTCGLPYHPGAAKFFAEKGFEVETK